MQRSPQASKDRTVVFSCGDDSYSVRDLIDAAFFRGELNPVWSEMLRLVAAENQAAELDLEIDETALDEASEKFRYEHDLITAEETERWLEMRGLTLDEFSGFFARHHWGSVLEGKAVAEEIDYLTASDDLRELLTAELILSGELDVMAARLGQRIAAGCEANGETVEPGAILEERQRFLQRTGVAAAQLAHLLDQLERDNPWLEEMLRMEALSQSKASALPTPEARAREFRSLRSPLTRFAVEIIELESPDAAREALLCVRNDGLSMAEVANEGRYPYRGADVVLEDVPEDWQQKFISATPGSVLDPIPRGDGFQLWRILEKKDANPDDPAVRERIDQRIIERHFSELCAKHIRWRFLS
jgi:hypothetical protein